MSTFKRQQASLEGAVDIGGGMLFNWQSLLEHWERVDDET